MPKKSFIYTVYQEFDVTSVPVALVTGMDLVEAVFASEDCLRGFQTKGGCKLITRPDWIGNTTAWAVIAKTGERSLETSVILGDNPIDTAVALAKTIGKKTSLIAFCEGAALAVAPLPRWMESGTRDKLKLFGFQVG